MDNAYSGTLSNNFANYDTDLLTKDTASLGWQLGGDLSENGAHVWIGTDNKVHYDASNISNVINGLGVGETLVDTFDYTIRMANGTLSVGHLSVTLVGENDAAVITAATHTTGNQTDGFSGNGVTEDAQGHEVGSETSTGTLAFTDADWHDTHAISVNNSGHLGTLSASVPVDTYTLDGIHYGSGDAATGEIDLSYSVADSAINYLGQGEQLTETFAVTLVEHHTNSTTDVDHINVSYIVTGTNDVASIAIADNAKLADVVDTDVGGESGSVGAAGTLAFTDVDLSDTHTVSVTGGTHGGTLSAHINSGDDSTGSGSGTISWTYSISDANIDNLTGATDTFVIHLNEYNYHGDLQDTVDKSVTVSLTGDTDIVINPEFDPNPPVAGDDHWVLSNNTNTGNSIDASWFTWNDTDLDHDPLFVTNVFVASGTAGINASYDGLGHLTSLQIAGETGDFTLGYTVSDGTLTDNGSVNVQVASTTSGDDTINLSSATYTGYDHSYIDDKGGTDFDYGRHRDQRSGRRRRQRHSNRQHERQLFCLSASNKFVGNLQE